MGGGVSEDCYWRYGFRSDEARTAFRDLSALLRACSDAPVTEQGAAVNHPDSFDQITARVGGRDVSLSLKDKGALGQTLVFLRRAL
jgi:hypothetical protein